MESTSSCPPVVSSDRSLAPDVPVAVHARQCPVERWLSFLGHRWTAIILWHLREGSLRHAELMSRLPAITAKVLGERLTGLHEAGLVLRSDGESFPRTTRYALTDQALALLQILDQIDVWSKRHQPGLPECS